MQYDLKSAALVAASADARNNVVERADKGGGNVEGKICFADRLDREGLKARFFV